MPRPTEYIFVQYKLTDVIHPMMGKVSETRNYDLSNDMFICLAKTKTHILIKNANPYRQLFLVPELLPMEILEVNWTVPGNFVKAYLREVEKIRKKIARHKKKGEQPPAPAQDPLADHPLLQLIRRGQRPGPGPDDESPGPTVVVVGPNGPTTPGAPGSS